MPGGPDGALLFVMALIFLLGCFLDFVEISVILLPIVVPTLIVMAHDPIWLSVLIAINLQTSFMPPPFGLSLFYLRSAAPTAITDRKRLAWGTGVRVREGLGGSGIIKT